MCASAARQRGVTLVELVVFMVVVGVALGGVVSVLGFTSANGADPVRRKQALMIAEGLLEEVLLARFSFCDPASADADSAAGSAACAIPEDWGQAGPEPTGGANGRPFDNVNDYVDRPGVATHAFDNAAGQLAGADGNALGVDGYTARLSIAPAVLGGIGAGGDGADTEVLRIVVQVDYDGQTLVLEGYRTRYAPNIP